MVKTRSKTKSTPATPTPQDTPAQPKQDEAKSSSTETSPRGMKTILQKESDMKEKGYKIVDGDEEKMRDTIQILPLGTRIAYFGLDKQGKVKARGGGWLLNKQDSRYFVLKSTAPYSSIKKPRFISFSVQYKNVIKLFYILRKDQELETPPETTHYDIMLDGGIYKRFKTAEARRKHMNTQTYKKNTEGGKIELIPK